MHVLLNRIKYCWRAKYRGLEPTALNYCSACHGATKWQRAFESGKQVVRGRYFHDTISWSKGQRSKVTVKDTKGHKTQIVVGEWAVEPLQTKTIQFYTARTCTVQSTEGWFKGQKVTNSTYCIPNKWNTLWGKKTAITLSKRFTVKWLLVYIYSNKFGTKRHQNRQSPLKHIVTVLCETQHACACSLPTSR